MRASSTRAASRGLVGCVVALCGLFIMGTTGSVQGQTARAAVLKDVVIDGRLDEWPEDLERYPIRNNFQVYGPTDLDGADLETSDDLSSHFRVAYDPDENLLYVAVEARDDEVVVGNDPMETDACEIYVHGLGREGKGISLQYAIVPGGWGSYGGGRENPAINIGSIRGTRSQGAFSRQGDITSYEWAIEVFDRFPDKPARLASGKNIAFDVVVVDKDGSDISAWVPWGPPMADKSRHAVRLGSLALLDASGNWSPAKAADAEPFEQDMEQFGEDMEEFGEQMARLATGMAAIGIEEAQRELAKGKWQGHPDLEEARRELEEARQEIEAERHRLQQGRRHWGRGMSESVIEDIVEITGAAFIILCIGLSIGVVVYVGRRGQKSPVSAELLDDLNARLDSIEQRLTDTQDVMIDLNEKYDNLDKG